MIDEGLEVLGHEYRNKVIPFINDEPEQRKHTINPQRETDIQFTIYPGFSKSPVEHHTVAEAARALMFEVLGEHRKEPVSQCLSDAGLAVV